MSDPEKVGEETQAELRPLLDELAEHDPEILELDLDLSDPATAMSIAIMVAATRGHSVSIATERDDGETEALTVEGLGKTADGQPNMVIGMGSTDGTLSPGSADAAAQLLQPGFDAEIDAITREGS